MVCPRCNYPLRHLPSHLCPECGLALDMSRIVGSWTRLREPRFTGKERPLPDFGLSCASCHAPLAGAMGATCPSCPSPLRLDARVPRRVWFNTAKVWPTAVPLPVAEGVLLAHYVPHMIDGEGATFGSAARWLMVHRDFFFDFLWLMRHEARPRSAPDDLDASAEWTCARCSSANPNHFDVCWSCQAER